MEEDGVAPFPSSNSPVWLEWQEKGFSRQMEIGGVHILYSKFGNELVGIAINTLKGF